jgi:RNA polymerase primary sigma factor
MQIKKLITIQDSDNLQRYFNEIKDYKPLLKEEERELIIKIQKSNDPQALAKLLNANLKFVISVAKRYQGQGAPLMDLISEGNAGMIEAAYRFNIKQDIKFYSYAVWWMRIKMFTNIDYNKRTIQLPANKELLVSKVKKCAQELEQELHRLPTLDELTDFVNSKRTKKILPAYTTSDIYDSIVHGGETQSLQDKVCNKDDSELLQDMLPGNMGIEDILPDDSMSNELNRFLFHLCQKEYDVLSLSLGIGGQNSMKGNNISKVLKIKEKEVVKLKSKALKRLRKLKNIDSLKDFIK